MEPHFPVALCYGQDRLAEICPDRVQVTPELHTPNDYYGQASVLKRYAGLPESNMLKVVLEHGIVLDDRVWNYDRDQRLPYLLASSATRAAQLRELTAKHIEPCGFGFLYARELVRRESPDVAESSRRGTLVFPCHSTHTVTAQYDHQDYAERILTLPQQVQPVSVCLYWRNFEFGHHEIYQRLGIPVFSAGHMYDRDFLLRTYDLCRRFRYAASNVFGTHYFQAIASGCGFFYLPSEEIEWDVPDVGIEGAARGTPLGPFQRAIHESSRQPWNAIDVERQRSITDQVLGVDSMKSPDELLDTLRQAEWADRFSPSVIRVGDYRVPAPPTFVRRRMRFIGKFQRSIQKRLPWRKAAA